MSKSCDNTEDDDAEDSPVLTEIPVFLSQTLAEKLVLYQYPLEHAGLNTENSNVIVCNIKQNPHEVMLELERNTESPNYYISRGEQIAINVDGNDVYDKNPEDVTFPRKLMDKQMFISKSVSDQNCAVGVFLENELHITPLKTVALLRPSFKYIDKEYRRQKIEAKDNNLDGDLSGEEEEELKQITVKFARQESEKIRKAREKSFGYVNKMNSKGVWCKSNFYNRRTDKSEISPVHVQVNSTRLAVLTFLMNILNILAKHNELIQLSEMEFLKLYCNRMGDRAKEVKMETDEILQIACDVEENESSSSHGDSLYSLEKLPLTEKVKKLLFQARLIHFSQLIKYLGNNCCVQDYLKVVQQVAVLVQGCWVVQSDVVYFKEIVPGGVSGSLMRTARDYILYLFTKSRTVTRRKILETVKLPPSLIKVILEELSYLLPSREWEFMLQTDHEFIKMYPDVAQRQLIKWEMKHEQLIESFKNSEHGLGGSSPAKQRRKSYRDSSLSSDNESGAESRRNTYQISGHKIRRPKKHSVSFSEVISKGENT